MVPCPSERRFRWRRCGQRAPSMGNTEILTLTATLLLMIATVAWMFREEG